MSVKQEDVWVEAWSNLLAELDEDPTLLLVTDNWRELSQSELQGWIQQEAYAGYGVRYEKVWYKGRRTLRYYRGYRIE